MLSEKEAIDDAPDAQDAVIDDAPAIYARYSRILYLLKTNRKKSETKRTVLAQKKMIADGKNNELLNFFSALSPFWGELFSVLQLMVSVVLNILSCSLMFLGNINFKLGLIIFLLVPFLNSGSIFKMHEAQNSVQLQNGFLPANHSFAPIARVQAVHTKYSSTEYMSRRIPDR